MRLERRMLRALAIVAAVAGATAAVVVVAFPGVLPGGPDRCVAHVPWSGAVVASRSSRTVAVRGDVEGMDDRFDCGPVVRPEVVETARSVTARVSGTDRQVRPVLGVDRTPTLTAVPGHRYRRDTGWDEATCRVSEWWSRQRHHQAQQIDLDLGPSASAATWGPPPGDAKRVAVGRSTALTWRQDLGDTVSSVVMW